MDALVEDVILVSREIVSLANDCLRGVRGATGQAAEALVDNPRP